MSAKSIGSSCAAFLGLVLLTSSSVAAPKTDGEKKADKNLPLADLIEQTEPSCVRIDVKLRNGSSIGSGFLIRDSNLVVTNHHVVAGAREAVCTFANGKKIEVEGYLAYDKLRDVAVLKLKSASDAKPLNLEKVQPRKGESTVAIGAPQGLSFTATEGIVSAIRTGKELEKFGTKATGSWLQTSTPISPGSSGGPLLNLRGRVVGINSAALASGQNLNFAISAEDIGIVLEQATNNKVASLTKIAPLRSERPRRGRPSTPGIAKTIVCKLPAKRKFGHRYRVQKEEDEFDKVTWLRTQWLPVRYKDKRITSCGLRVGVPYKDDSPSPAVLWQIGTTSKNLLFRGSGGRRFQLLLDGEPIKLTEPRSSTSLIRGTGWKIEMSTLIRLDVYLQIIAAKEVKARLGDLEYEINANQLECLRDLAFQLPTGKTGLGDLITYQVERYKLVDDPTIPASAAKRIKAKLDRENAKKEKKTKIVRTWTSKDGKYVIVASLVKLDGLMVVLKRKDTGKELRVPLTKLSKDDRDFVKGR